MQVNKVCHKPKDILNGYLDKYELYIISQKNIQFWM